MAYNEHRCDNYPLDKERDEGGVCLETNRICRFEGGSCECPHYEPEGIFLKPCPFCGGEAYVEFACFDYNLFHVVCCNSGCGGISNGYDSEQEAADHWNRRAGDE